MSASIVTHIHRELPTFSDVYTCSLAELHAFLHAPAEQAKQRVYVSAEAFVVVFNTCVVHL